MGSLDLKICFVIKSISTILFIYIFLSAFPSFIIMNYLDQNWSTFGEEFFPLKIFFFLILDVAKSNNQVSIKSNLIQS